MNNQQQAHIVWSRLTAPDLHCENIQQRDTASSKIVGGRGTQAVGQPKTVAEHYRILLSNPCRSRIIKPLHSPDQIIRGHQDLRAGAVSDHCQWPVAVQLLWPLFLLIICYIILLCGCGSCRPEHFQWTWPSLRSQKSSGGICRYWGPP